MPEDGAAQQSDELGEDDLELDDEELERVGGGDKAPTGRATISDISITKQIDKASTKLYEP